MVPRSEPATMKWARRRDIPIAILAWITLVFAILWGAGHIARTPGLTHAGVLQALVVALWKNWRATHPEQFAQAEQQIADKIDESLTDHPASTSKDTMSDDC